MEGAMVLFMLVAVLIQAGGVQVSYDGAPVWSVAWNRSGTELAFGDRNGVVVTRRVEGSNKLVRAAHKGSVTALAWSDDDRLATGGSDGQVRIWKNGKLQRELRHTDGITCLAWSSDGTLLAAGYADQSVGVYLAESGKNKGLIKLPDVAGGMSFSPDDAVLAIATSSQTSPSSEVSLWSTKGWNRTAVTKLTTRAIDRPTMAWSPNGATLAVGAEDGSLLIWPSRQVPRVIQCDAWISALSWNGDSTRLAVGCNQGLLLVVLPDGTMVNKQTIGANEDLAMALAWSGPKLAMAQKGESGLVLWQLEP